MPAPTWGWLRMNDTQIEIPMSLAPGGSTEVDAEDRLFDHAMSFEGAVAELQARLDAARATARARTIATHCESCCYRRGPPT